jgi:hypothetical protein
MLSASRRCATKSLPKSLRTHSCSVSPFFIAHCGRTDVSYSVYLFFVAVLLRSAQRCNERSHCSVREIKGDGEVTRSQSLTCCRRRAMGRFNNNRERRINGFVHDIPRQQGNSHVTVLLRCSLVFLPCLVGGLYCNCRRPCRSSSAFLVCVSLSHFLGAHLPLPSRLSEGAAHKAPTHTRNL